MKYLKIVSAILLIFSSSCAMMLNDSNTDKLRIDSSPQGASINIDGQYYGTTPATIDIRAKNYTVKLSKDGYKSTELQLKSVTSATRSGCLADAIGSILIITYYSAFYSGYCDEFKEKQYFATLPQESVRVNQSGRNSYYNQQGGSKNYYGGY
jgi:hypothetical protein